MAARIGGRHQLRDRRDSALAGTGRASRLRLVDGRFGELDRARRLQSAKRVAPVTQGDAPVRHRAVRVAGENTLERLDGFREPERVQERDTLVEVLPHRGGARGLELHAALPI